MRIVVLGDFHIHDEELELTRQAIEDVARAKPDLVVALGDFGCAHTIGSPAGLEKTYGLLRSTGARIRPILGNHDLQRESGRGSQRKHTMSRALKRLYRLERIYDVEEYDNFRIFYLCCEPQPARSCYQVQECYISRKQFEWFTAKLRERPHTPALIFSHAPPLGSGLRTVPDVHVRSTNAYLDQNHDPCRWSDLIRAHPGYALWFSAHYHLGHDGPGAHVVWERGCSFTTAVHGSATRDGCRQSRVIDVTDRRVVVSTLDHAVRSMRIAPDWVRDMDADLEGSLAAAVRDGGWAPTDQGWRKTAEVHVGLYGERPARIELVHERLVYAGTKEGYLWEASPTDRAVMGTLQLGPSVDDVAAVGKSLWWCAGGSVYAARMNDLGRFARLKSANPEPPRIADAPPGRPALAADGAGRAWVAGSGKLLRLDRKGPAAEYVLPLGIGRPRACYPLGRGRLELLNDAGELWYVEPGRNKYELVSDGWLSWHRAHGSAAGIRRNEIVWFAGGDPLAMPLDGLGLGGLPAKEELARCEVVCGRDGASIVRIGGRVYAFRKPRSRPELLCGDGAAIVSSGREGTLFGIYKSAEDPSAQPLLELWMMEGIQSEEEER